VDIVSFNPIAERTMSAETHDTNIDCNSYEDLWVKWLTDAVLSRRKVIIDQYTYLGTLGEGHFLKRSPCGWK
jgi:dihydropyrimidinase